jgi:hypothetical protein
MVDDTLACPPRMSDGRSFTRYADRCSVSDAWRNANAAEPPLGSNAARQYLIRNADQIMASNRDAAEKNNRCGSCFGASESGTMLPELEMQICNTKTCTFAMSDNKGLGMGRKTYA